MVDATDYDVCASGCDETDIQSIFDNNDLAGDDTVEIQADSPGGSKTYTVTSSIDPGDNDDGTDGHPIQIFGRSGDTIIITSRGELSGWDTSGNWTGSGGTGNLISDDFTGGCGDWTTELASCANDRVEVDYTDQSGKEAAYQSFTSQTDVYAQWDVTYHSYSIPTATKESEGTCLSLNGGSNERACVGLRNTGGTVFIYGLVKKDSGATRTDTDITPTPDQEYEIRMHWKIATGDGNNDGVFQVWVDGTLKIDLSNVDNDTLAANRIDVGEYWSNDAGNDQNSYWDNVDVGTTEFWSGGTTWTFTLATRPWRIWLDSTEYPPADSALNVDATHRWHYANATNTLTLYAAENPATAYSSIEIGNNSGGDFNGTILLDDSDYLEFYNLDVRGSYCAFKIAGADGISLHNLNIGQESHYGLWLYGDADDGELYSSTIDSGWAFSTLTYYSSDGGPVLGDGIAITDGANDWVIYGNTITDWGHSGLHTESDNGSFTNTNIYFYNNDVSGSNSHYMRGFDIEGNSGLSSNIVIHHNWFHDMNVKLQVASSNNIIYGNLITDITNSPALDDVGMGISLEVYESKVCSNNKIYNNTFKNIASVGLRLTTFGTATDIAGNEIKNNIFENTGTDSTSYSNLAAFVENDTNVNSNEIDNNDFYISGQSTIISYRGTSYTVTNFESNVAQSDTAADNEQVDPLTTDGGYLQIDSPCDGTGADLGDGSTYRVLDPNGIAAGGWPNYVFTLNPDEHGWPIGAYGRSAHTMSIP